MNRRQYLAVACVPLLVGVVGCSGEDGDPIREGTGTGGKTGTSDAPERETSETSDVTGDIWIVVRNTAADGATVRLAVSTDGNALFEGEVGVPPSADRAVDPGIDEAGRYDLEVAVEGGPSESYPFSVGEYDLRMGSNLIVSIRDDELRIMIEE